VVNRIAAGEVVERPASVVKELIENALDAGAGQVEVEVREGGRGLVRVVDDGHGVGAEDLSRIFLPHSTSKLTDVEDLLHIASLGFRGEALASIGAVSRARVLSRPSGEVAGHEVVNEFGEISPVRPAASPEGTTVEAADLFRNVPARARFLKSVSAEMARITETVHRFGIAHPGVELRLTHGGRPVAHFPADLGPRDRIALAYGRNLREELLEATADEEGVHLQVWLAPPSTNRRDTSRMLFFLNGRHVRDRTLIHAVRHAYEDLIFGPRHPVVFVFLTMDPGDVDQNVHPAKLEVRFRDSGGLHALLRRTVRERLTAADLAHPVPVKDGPGEVREERIRRALDDFLERGERRPEGSLFPPGPVGAGAPRPAAGALDFLQVGDTYVVLETDEGIEILDQHALHERVLYDRIRARYDAGEPASQGLLRPLVVELDPVEAETLLSAREELQAAGLRVEPFGDGGVAVQGVPAAVPDADPLELLQGALERLSEGAEVRGERLVEGLIASMACRAAVKAGDRLRPDQVADLLTQAETLTHAHTCPHGRPTALRLTFADLERHFKRK
jgi:DNA mismatch repair protein MutL